MTEANDIRPSFVVDVSRRLGDQAQGDRGVREPVHARAGRERLAAARSLPGGRRARGPASRPDDRRTLRRGLRHQGAARDRRRRERSPGDRRFEASRGLRSPPLGDAVSHRPGDGHDRDWLRAGRRRAPADRRPVDGDDSLWDRGLLAAARRARRHADPRARRQRGRRRDRHERGDRCHGARHERHRRRPFRPLLGREGRQAPRPERLGLGAERPHARVARGQGAREACRKTGRWRSRSPGAVAGWQALLDRFGTKPLAELLAPAIHYANEGFPLGEITALAWAAASGKLTSPSAARTYLLDGRPPQAGQVFRNPDLARSLDRIAARGTGRLLQAERPPRRSCRALRDRGGTMTLEDLAELAPEWVEPISRPLPRLERLRDPAEHPGHRRADDARDHGAVPARRVGLPLAARAARDDRGQEAGLRRHAALRGRPALLDSAGRGAARPGARGRAREADRHGEGRLRGRARPARRAHRLRRAATRSTCPSWTRTATSSR